MNWEYARKSMKYTIATIASHSSLQILKGAKDEGFATLAVATNDKVTFYKRFKFIDEIIGIDSYNRFYDLKDKLKKKKVIIVPHGSFVAYLGKEGDKKISLPTFGNKKILDIEGDRMEQYRWLKDADLNLPKIFTHVEEVDRVVIVKLHGAKGGSGYFIAKDQTDLKLKLKKYNWTKNDYIIQEYIIGVPVYLQYFYSSLNKNLELMGIDRRYESNVDGIGRIPSNVQQEISINPSYTVIGNFPIVLRESLLPKVYEMGEKVVSVSKRLIPPHGLYGPFCLETIVTANQQFYCIEISCRIVAGTNLYILGSPYTDLTFGEPMSTGRRIALEIKRAIREDKLYLITD